MKDAKTNLLAIVGPTGVGKSEVALFLAKNLNGEIVNFDSVQLYKDLNIGTAKPSEEERKEVPHHLYDVLEIWEECNAAKYIKMADRIIREIIERGKIPILVGGTGLYLRALEYGLFPIEIPEDIRIKVRERAKNDLEGLYQELSRLDPEYARKISPRDRVRITRALEVIYATSKPFSQFHKENPFFGERRYKILKIGLNLPRKELYKRINERVLKMVEKGWLEEVKGLMERGFGPQLKLFKAIGYRYLVEHIEGKISLDEAISLVQRDTRRYAKRQITWFKKEPDVVWFSPEDKEKILVFVKENLTWRA